MVLQSVRGTFGSAGDFVPMAHEAADGADTVEWMRRQRWFTGRFATIGVSYLGFTQYALLQDPPRSWSRPSSPPVPMIWAHRRGVPARSRSTTSSASCNLIAHQEDPDRIRAGIRRMRAQKGVVRAAAEAPLGASGRTLLGEGAPWWESWSTPPADDNPFWGPLNVAPPLTRSRCRCCCSAAGETCSWVRRSISSGTFVSGASTSR